MPLNLDAKETFHVFDKYGMLCIPSDDLSWKDSLGRTVLAWIAYERPIELLIAIGQCAGITDNDYSRESRLITLIDHRILLGYSPGKIKLKRHPAYDEKASRDHWSYFIIFSKLIGSNPEPFREFIKRVPRMRGMNLWRKALAGNKRAEWWYYFWQIPGAYLGNAWNRLIMLIGGAGPERTNEWWIERPEGRATNGELLQRSLTKWQKFWLHGLKYKWKGEKRTLEFLIPVYSLHNKAWQLYIMPKCIKKDALKKILLKRVGKSNIMLRLLFADSKTQNSRDSVTQEEIDNYPHMTGYRPGVYLDETCRRHIRELTPQEAEFNAYEKDLVVWLWSKMRQRNLIIETMQNDEKNGLYT